MGLRFASPCHSNPCPKATIPFLLRSSLTYLAGTLMNIAADTTITLHPQHSKYEKHTQARGKPSQAATEYCPASPPWASSRPQGDSTGTVLHFTVAGTQISRTVWL